MEHAETAIKGIRKRPPPRLPGRGSFTRVTRPGGQSTRTHPFRATEGVCQSGTPAISIRATCRGQFVLEWPESRLHRTLIAGGWSPRVCRYAVLRALCDRRSPLPFAFCCVCVQSSVVTPLRGSRRVSLGRYVTLRARPIVRPTGRVRTLTCRRVRVVRDGTIGRTITHSDRPSGLRRATVHG